VVERKKNTTFIAFLLFYFEKFSSVHRRSSFPFFLFPFCFVERGKRGKERRRRTRERERKKHNNKN